GIPTSCRREGAGLRHRRARPGPLDALTAAPREDRGLRLHLPGGCGRGLSPAQPSLESIAACAALIPGHVRLGKSVARPDWRSDETRPAWSAPRCADERSAAGPLRHRNRRDRLMSDAKLLELREVESPSVVSVSSPSSTSSCASRRSSA